MLKEDKFKQKIPDIIIVDDVAANLKVLGEILKGEGYRVRPVLSGLQALQAAEKEKPDLIILDVMMPAMNGYEVAGRLRKDPKLNDIPIIFISALNDGEDIIKAFQSGGVDYIAKPFKAEEVKARIATHLKISQQNQELHRLNIEKDKFFSIIAHDLRGPMGGFMGLTEIMADESQIFSEEERKELALDLKNSAQSTFNLLEQLLEWSQMERGLTDFKPQTLLLRDLTEKSILPILESAKVKALEISIDIPNTLVFFADRNMVQTILRNLTSNAIKFTPEGGKVSISARKEGNDTVRIAVEDTGIGMNPQMVENLFRIDINTKRPGTNGEHSTGLGLILCKEFIEKNGGHISVASQLGQGSVFSFTLPFDGEKEVPGFPEVSQISDPGEKIMQNLKIVIAEDDEISGKLLAAMVKGISSTILIARNGTEAVAICQQNADIDLVLMDISMPLSDGFEATRQIRQFNSDVIIIAQTSLSLAKDIENAKVAGCNDHISKPIKKTELMALIEKYVNH